MTDQEALKIAIALMDSVSMDERMALIWNTLHVNDKMVALATAAAYAANDPNTLRLALDTAYCIGVRAGKMADTKPTPQNALPIAQARYGGVGSPVSGARRIIVDHCPYCGRMHTHLEVVGVPDSNQRLADCFRGEYILEFTP